MVDQQCQWTVSAWNKTHFCINVKFICKYLWSHPLFEAGNRSVHLCTDFEPDGILYKHHGDLRSALFWDITQCRMLVSYRCFGATYRSYLQGSSSSKRMRSSWTAWPLKMGPIGCPEMSTRNYHFTLRKISKECRSRLRRDRSLKLPGWLLLMFEVCYTVVLLSVLQEKSLIVYPWSILKLIDTVKSRFNIPTFSEIPDLVMIFSCPYSSSV
jgi:hypothetical protein